MARPHAAPDVVDLTADEDDGGGAREGEGAAAAATTAAPLLEELRGDLFTVDSHVSLAHCVGRDLKLGKGTCVRTQLTG